MATMASIDATKLADRLHGVEKDDFWLHLETASMLEKYPAKQHARRVRDKLDVSQGLIYLPSQPAKSNEDSDMPAPFRQRRYFYYLSGCNEPNCHLTYDIQHDKLSLFIPRINPERVIWNGRGSTPAEALDKYDIDEVYFTDNLPAWMQDWSLQYQGRLYVLHEDQAPTVPFFGKINFSSLQLAANLTRMIKDDHEIKLIRKANDISSEAHKQVLANITKFKNEAQVEGLFMDVCISNQAKQQAYDPIAASGPNAGTLHYDANNEDFEDRQLMCLDAGCEYELYASDITRTFPLSGSWPSVESENIYKLVQRMQETCIRRLAPGVRYLDLHILAHHIAIDGLLRLGILHNGTIEEIYKAGTSKAFFPHGLGHHVGLEVHDVGQRELMSYYQRNPKYEKAPSLYPEDYHLPIYDEKLCLAPADPQSPHLEEGMVVTVEPGIYFSAYALSYFYMPSPIHSKYINKDVLYRYFPVGGVRIEDDILITHKGYENLTTAPKGKAMLEIIRSGNAKWPFVSASEINSSRVKRKEVIEEPMLRAPGIPKTVNDPRIKPAVRASTMPVERSSVRRSADFEPFDGPSLFSGFKQSATMKEPLQPAASRPRRASASESHAGPPVCGNASPDTTHLYMAWQSSSGDGPISRPNSSIAAKRKCKNCMVLMQTLDRLRQIKASQTGKSSGHSLTAENAALKTTMMYTSPGSGPLLDYTLDRVRQIEAPQTGKSSGHSPTAGTAAPKPTMIYTSPGSGPLIDYRKSFQPPFLRPDFTESNSGPSPDTHSGPVDHPETTVKIPFIPPPPMMPLGSFPPPPPNVVPRSTGPQARSCKIRHDRRPTPANTVIPTQPSESQTPRNPTPTQVSTGPSHAAQAPSSDPRRHCSAVYPSVAPFTTATTATNSIAAASSSTNTPPDVHRQGIRPQEATLWQQLEELRVKMEGLLRERGGG